MNTITFRVLEIKSNPYFAYNNWFVTVISTSHGGSSEHTLMFNTKEEADNLKIGYEYLG